MAKTYREQSEELEELLAKLQGGNLTVDEALPVYQEAQKLIKALEKQLAEAENQVKKLTVQLPE